MMLFFPPVKGGILWITPPRWVILRSQHVSSASIDLCGKAGTCLSPSGMGALLSELNAKESYFWWCTSDQGADVEGNFLDGVLSEEMFTQWLQGQEFSSRGDRVQEKPSIMCNSAKHCQFLSSWNKKTGFHSNFVQADSSWQITK